MLASGSTRQGRRMPSPPGLILFLVLLSASLGARARAASRDESSGSLGALVREAAAWVVAVEVVRKEDLPGPRGLTGRFSEETKTYYQRPQGPVSGILLDREGHVLTTLYNVGGTVTEITVILPGARRLPARVVASSAQDDTALLQLEGFEPSEDFEAPKWAEASSLRPGRFLVVVGRSPDPESPTATQGIISAVTRNGGRVLQTDAKINYGNVGGAVVDLEGRLVGMASFVGHTRPQWGLNSGVGFATASPTLQEILPGLKEGKDIKGRNAAFLGVQCERTPGEGGGAPVTRVVEGSAADKAGIKAGDVIAAVNGEELLDFDHMRRVIFPKKPGESIRIVVRRGGEQLDMEVVLGSMPDL